MQTQPIVLPAHFHVLTVWEVQLSAFRVNQVTILVDQSALQIVQQGRSLSTVQYVKHVSATALHALALIIVIVTVIVTAQAVQLQLIYIKEPAFLHVQLSITLMQITVDAMHVYLHA